MTLRTDVDSDVERDILGALLTGDLLLADVEGAEGVFHFHHHRAIFDVLVEALRDHPEGTGAGDVGLDLGFVLRQCATRRIVPAGGFLGGSPTGYVPSMARDAPDRVGALRALATASSLAEGRGAVPKR